MLDKLQATPASPGWPSASKQAPTASGPTSIRASISNEVFEVVDAVRAAGINVIGNYIFGLPEDDAETMQATLDLAMELNCEFANFYSAMAYPGSPLYDMAVRQGVPLPRSGPAIRSTRAIACRCRRAI